jgi:hypothetical protein
MIGRFRIGSICTIRSGSGLYGLRVVSVEFLVVKSRNTLKTDGSCGGHQPCRVKRTVAGKLPHMDKAHTASSLLHASSPGESARKSCSLPPLTHLRLAVSRIIEMTCESDNTQAVDQSRFWSNGSIHWDAHRVGWTIAGACTAVVRVYLSIKRHRFIFLA